MLLSFKYRLYPNRAQEAALDGMLTSFCALYNAGLQQRIEAYQRQGKSASIITTNPTSLRPAAWPMSGLQTLSYSAGEQVLRRVGKAFKAFFRRCKAGEKPGFPRFRAATRYHSADFRVGDGLTLRKSGRLGIVGIPGEIKCKWHRALPSVPKSAILDSAVRQVVRRLSRRSS